MESSIHSTVRIDGDRIKALRLQKGLTQLYLASFVGVTTDTISRWENKKIPSIKRENALKLAEALEVSLDEILLPLDQHPSAGNGSEESRPPRTGGLNRSHDKEGAGQGPEDHWSPPDDAGGIDFGESDLEPEVRTGAGPSDSVSRDKAEEAEGKRPRSRLSPWLFIIMGIVLAGAGLFMKVFLPEQKIEPDDIELIRLLPAHAASGAVIPVILEVDSFAPEGISMIITETIPRGSAPVSAAPPYKKFLDKEHSLKWIHKTCDGDASLAYLLRLPRRNGSGGRFRFSGQIRLKTGLDSIEKAIGGDRFIEVEQCHWADADCDHTIDDEEILAVYDRYGEIKIFDSLLKMVEDIWTEGAYVIDEKTGRIRPVPPAPISKRAEPPASDQEKRGAQDEIRDDAS